MMVWSHLEPTIRLVCFLTVLPAMMPGWWDRLFGTYRDQPRDGHAGMTIGLEYFRDWRAIRLYGLLAQPFMNPASGSKPAPYPSNPLP